MKSLAPLGILFFFASAMIMLEGCASTRPSKEFVAEYYALAEGYSEIGKYDKAIFFYQKALTRPEYRNGARYGLARAYALNGNWAAACDIFADLYRQDPKNALLAASYAYALASTGKIEEALRLYGALYQERPDDSTRARNYAELLFLAGHYAESSEMVALLKDKFADSPGAKDIAALEKKIADATAPPQTETSPSAVPADGAESTTSQTSVASPSPTTAP